MTVTHTHAPRCLDEARGRLEGCEELHPGCGTSEERRKALLAVALRACLEGGSSSLDPAPLFLLILRSHLYWLLAIDQEGEGGVVSEGASDVLCGLQNAWVRRRTMGVEWCPRQQSCSIRGGGRRRRMAQRVDLQAPGPQGQGQGRILLA
jgi:hypothetical protein